jgi:hypothetical protein
VTKEEEEEEEKVDQKGARFKVPVGAVLSDAHPAPVATRNGRISTRRQLRRHVEALRADTCRVASTLITKNKMYFLLRKLGLRVAAVDKNLCQRLWRFCPRVAETSA